jgi:hypothetical protein
MNCLASISLAGIPERWRAVFNGVTARGFVDIPSGSSGSFRVTGSWAGGESVSVFFYPLAHSPRRGLVFVQLKKEERYWREDKRKV